ncbi:MAG TPA: STN domain-containing protein [Opitutaceae bacterium]
MSNRGHRPLGRTFLPLAALFSAVLIYTINAAEPMRRTFALPAESAELSLKRFSAQAGCEVLFASRLAKGVLTNPVQGDFPPREALERMLDGTGLVAVHDHKTSAFSIRKETREEAHQRRKSKG